MDSSPGFATKLLCDFRPGYLASLGIGFFTYEMKRHLVALIVPHPLQDTQPGHEIAAATGEATQDNGWS